MNYSDALHDLAIAVGESAGPLIFKGGDQADLARVLAKSARRIAELERELRAASANVDHMRGVVSRQIALRVEAQARAGRLAKDSRR